MESLVEPVTVQVYVDVNHTGNLSKRRPHSVILIYVNNKLIKFYSKIQNTVESSSFGLDFVVFIIATEMVE